MSAVCLRACAYVSYALSHMHDCRQHCFSLVFLMLTVVWNSTVLECLSFHTSLYIISASELQDSLSCRIQGAYNILLLFYVWIYEHSIPLMSAGPETMLKPPLSFFSHPQQTFQCMDSLHQLGPPPMAPIQPLGPPPTASAQGIGPPTVVGTRTLAPPPINTSHSLRPPPITASHSLGPPPMAPAQPLRLPPMAHTLGPTVPPNMDLTQPLGLPPLNPALALVPPPVVTPGNGQLPLPPTPLSSPPPPCPEPSQLPKRLPPPAIIPAPVSCLISSPLLGQGPLPSEQPQEDNAPMGADEHEDATGLGELCKPLYCKLCNVTLNSAQQAQAHYQVRRCILPAKS